MKRYFVILCTIASIAHAAQHKWATYVRYTDATLLCMAARILQRQDKHFAQQPLESAQAEIQSLILRNPVGRTDAALAKLTSALNAIESSGSTFNDWLLQQSLVAIPLHEKGTKTVTTYALSREVFALITYHLVTPDTVDQFLAKQCIKKDAWFNFVQLQELSAHTQYRCTFKRYFRQFEAQQAICEGNMQTVRPLIREQQLKIHS